MKGSALKPDFFMSNMPSLMADKVAEKRGATEEERLLYTLSKSAGWRILSEYIDEIVEDLDKINEVAIDKGATFDVIGQNTVVINLAKAILKKIPLKVQDAKESCENADGTNK